MLDIHPAGDGTSRIWEFLGMALAIFSNAQPHNLSPHLSSFSWDSGFTAFWTGGFGLADSCHAHMPHMHGSLPGRKAAHLPMAQPPPLISHSCLFVFGDRHTQGGQNQSTHSSPAEEQEKGTNRSIEKAVFCRVFGWRIVLRDNARSISADIIPILLTF